MASEFDIRELYRPDGIVPVNVETTAGLVREVLRLRLALDRIDAVAVSKKAGALVRMQRIARQALNASVGGQS